MFVSEPPSVGLIEMALAVDVLYLSPAGPVAPVIPVVPVGPVEPVGPSMPSRFTLYVAEPNVPVIFSILLMVISPVVLL